MLAAPQLLVAFDQAIQLRAGTSLHIPLNAIDPEGDAITFSASVDNAAFEAVTPQGNRSVIFRLSHESSGQQGDVTFTDEIMTVELLEDIAPETAGRFAGLVDADAYNGLTFHRLVSNFAAQFGDPDGVGTGGSGVTIDDEFTKYSRHTTPFLLSTAKSLDDTFDMQAFLTQGGANSTRNLDFNHTVFGVVTSFSSEISFNIPVTQNPVTGENTFPVSPITISDASVYIDDQNGVLRLYVPDDVPVGTTATVTLTLTDANGETSTETLMVEVAADPFNDQPFFDPDPAPVTTDFNVPVTFTLQATDIENDPIEFLEGTAGEYSQRGLTQNPNVQVSVDPDTGEVTVTPNEMIAGTIAVLVKVRQVSGNNGASDFQVVPVSIRPPAIDGVVLLSDSGVLDDNITAVNNSNQLPLQFRADGVFAGVPVQLLIDGEVVQEITPTEAGSVVFTLDGDTPVADGTHDVVARLVAYNILQFGNFDQFAVPGLEHEPLSITIDTRPIVFESSPVTQATLLAPYTYDVATDRDGEAGLEYSLLESPDGMTIDPSTGVIQWTPTADQGGETTVSVQAVDVAGNANSQTFNIYVNTPPVLLEVGNKSVDEGMLLEVQLMVDDPDAGETFTYQLFGVVPTGAAIDSSGKFTFTPTEAQGPNTFNINVRVTDSRGGTDQTTFAVQVNEVPQPPVISPIADQLVLPGGSLSFNVVATDPDIPQQGLGFSLDPGAPDGAAIDPVTGLFTYNAPTDQPLGELSVTVRVTEVAGEELSSTVTFKINIVENLPPVFPDQQTDFSTKASEPLSFDVVAVDPGPGSEELVYSLEPGTPDFVTIDPATGRVTVTTTRQTPPQTVEIVVRVTEATDQDATATKTFSVEITDPPNLPPVFPDQPMSFTTQASVPLTFGVTAIDPDEVPVPLIYSLEPGTPNFVTIDPSTGQVTVTTTRQTPTQTLDIVVRVTEDRADALSATKVFTVEITTAPNLPPAFPAQPTEFTTEVGDLLSFDAVAVDPEQVALIYSLEPGAPQIVSIDSATGKVTVNSSTSTLPQTIKFVVRATEPGAGGLSATQEYTVNLVPISNQSPVINPTVRQAVRQGLQVKFNIDAYDPDSPATPLVYSLGPDAPPEATINPLTGEVTFAATPNTTVGVYRFGVQVAESAADGLTTGSTIEVQVNPLGIRELIGIGNTRFGPDPSSLVPSTTDALSSTSLAGFFSSTTSTSTSPGRSPLTPITPDNFPGTPFNNITYGVNTGVGQSYTKDGEEAEQEEGENLEGDQLPNEENSQENSEGVVPTQAIEPVEDSDGDKKAEGDAAVEGEEKAPKAAMWDDRLIDWATTEHWTPGDESFARTMNASVNRMRNSGHSNDPYDIDLEPLVAPHMSVGAKQQAAQAPQFGPSRGSSSTLVVPAPGSEEATSSTAQEPPVEVEKTVSDEMATVAAASMAIYMPMLVTDLPEAKQSRRRWRKWLGEG